MSRLQSRRSQQANKKIILMIILSIGLLYFFFQVGLKSAIGSAVFVNNLMKGNPPEIKGEKNEDFYGLLNVDEPEIATNAATILVTGDATEFSEVEFYLNNVKAETDTVSSSGTFSKEIGNLRVGENKMYVLAQDASGKHTKKSETYTILYKDEKPKLDIESPKDNDKVTKSDVSVKGKTDKDTNVKVNNQPVVVGFEGDFTTIYRLKEGENKLEFTVTDTAGNVEKKTITVVYQKDE